MGAAQSDVSDNDGGDGAWGKTKANIMKDLLGTVRIAVMTPCIKLSVNGKSVRHKAWGTQCANMILANKSNIGHVVIL